MYALQDAAVSHGQIDRLAAALAVYEIHYRFNIRSELLGSGKVVGGVFVVLRFLGELSAAGAQNLSQGERHLRGQKTDGGQMCGKEKDRPSPGASYMGAMDEILGQEQETPGLRWPSTPPDSSERPQAHRRCGLSPFVVRGQSSWQEE